MNLIEIAPFMYTPLYTIELLYYDSNLDWGKKMSKIMIMLRWKEQQKTTYIKSVTINIYLHMYLYHTKVQYLKKKKKKRIVTCAV